jgi:hypothetical protein
MIFKTLTESEEHSNLLILAQSISLEQKNNFPESFLFYMFSKYYPFNLIFSIRNHNTIPIRTRINGRLNEVAIMEYMNNGNSILLADEFEFDPGEIKKITDALRTTNDYDSFNANKKFLNIPYFGMLECTPNICKAWPYGCDVELRFNLYTKTTEWTIITNVLINHIEKTKTQLTNENIESLKILLSEILMMDIMDVSNDTFLKNISSYNKLIEMLNI